MDVDQIVRRKNRKVITVVPSTTMVDAARTLSENRIGLLMVVKAKVKGTTPVIAKAPERGEVINLMDALKRSIDEGDSKKPPAKSQPRKKSTGKSATKRKTAAKSGGRKKKAAGAAG